MELRKGCFWAEAVPKNIREFGRAHPKEGQIKQALAHRELILEPDAACQQADKGDPNLTCGKVITINLFFDGTNNHKGEDKEKDKEQVVEADTHTNVARLYDACRENGTHHFRHYIQGVGTEFKEIDEPLFTQKGKAFATGFAARVSLGYIQTLNSLHRAMKGDVLWKLEPAGKAALSLAEGRPPKHEQAQLKNLQIATGEGSLAKPYRIQRAYLNVFGFSRGAAEARVFVYRLMNIWARDGKLCESIPYTVNFVGLFDTVASVGLADSAKHASYVGSWFDLADGHYGWAADNALAIPDGVNRCVHFFSAHEQRASFPLDSIRSSPKFRERHLEVAYPGVHSDVGGGYAPGDQGKSRDGRSAEGEAVAGSLRLLSKIPLHDMYIEALRWDVPLETGKPLLAGDDLKMDFRIAPDVVDAFNAWLGERAGQAVAVEAALTHGYRESLAWRVLRSNPLSPGDYIDKQAFFQEATEDGLTADELERATEESLKGDKDYQKLQADRNHWQFEASHHSDNRYLADEAKGKADAAELQMDKIRTKTMQAKLNEKLGPGKERTVRGGEGASDVVCRDKTDLMEAAEEFQLLMAYVLEPSTVWQAKPLPPDPRTPASNNENEAVVRNQPPLSVKRKPVSAGRAAGGDKANGRYVVLASKSLVTTLVSLLSENGHYSDALLLPEKSFVPFIKKVPETPLRKAAIALLDDYIHDSRAWFRVPTFHELSPGGYGCPRVWFEGERRDWDYVKKHFDAVQV